MLVAAVRQQLASGRWALRLATASVVHARRGCSVSVCACVRVGCSQPRPVQAGMHARLLLCARALLAGARGWMPAPHNNDLTCHALTRTHMHAHHALTRAKAVIPLQVNNHHLMTA